MTFAPTPTCIKKLGINPSGEGCLCSPFLKIPQIALLGTVDSELTRMSTLPNPGYRVSLAAPCHDVVIPQLKYKPGGENGKNNIITLTRPGDPASTPQPHNSERRNNNAIAHIVHKRMTLRAKLK